MPSFENQVREMETAERAWVAELHEFMAKYKRGELNINGPVEALRAIAEVFSSHPHPVDTFETLLEDLGLTDDEISTATRHVPRGFTQLFSLMSNLNWENPQDPDLPRQLLQLLGLTTQHARYGDLLTHLYGIAGYDVYLLHISVIPSSTQDSHSD